MYTVSFLYIMCNDMENEDKSYFFRNNYFILKKYSDKVLKKVIVLRNGYLDKCTICWSNTGFFSKTGNRLSNS